MAKRKAEKFLNIWLAFWTITTLFVFIWKFPDIYAAFQDVVFGVGP